MIHIRNRGRYQGEGTYVGRPSPLGNPFIFHTPFAPSEFRVANRKEAVERYGPWLREKLKTDPAVKEAFNSLVSTYRDSGELTLICWCAPISPCHAEVIRDFIIAVVGDRDAGVSD